MDERDTVLKRIVDDVIDGDQSWRETIQERVLERRRRVADVTESCIPHEAISKSQADEHQKMRDLIDQWISEPIDPVKEEVRLRLNAVLDSEV